MFALLDKQIASLLEDRDLNGDLLLLAIGLTRTLFLAEPGAPILLSEIACSLYPGSVGEAMQHAMDVLAEDCPDSTGGGGVLARHVDLNWPAIWRQFDPTMTDDALWQALPRRGEPVEERPALRLVRG